ncbi:DUF2953 domain-containing protein [[Clostridium] dakarense]|uniref:DUF2953 domain-containing protein n=1 Tax=Faecalimicrobium dakarense TaxID=1301100 RepID=UPI0004BC45A4|nr:DUF2953 domain-containing protein [[Clostridium] dakarense]
MRYNGIFDLSFLLLIILLLIVGIIIITLKSSLHIIISSKIRNEDISIKINIKYLFNLINIDKQLYPPSNKGKSSSSNKKKGNKKGKGKLLNKDYLTLYRLFKKIKIHEVYSKIEFGSEIINFTTFIYVLINAIYGNIANIVDADKIHLGVTPNFTKNYLKADMKVHAKPTIRDLVTVARAGYKIYKNNKGNKEDGTNESNRFNKKSYGNNS